MKYEFKLKEKYRGLNIWEDKYVCVCDERAYELVKDRYEKYAELNKSEVVNYVVIINLLNDNGDFVRVIQ